jgi:hypothetical protein
MSHRLLMMFLFVAPAAAAAEPAPIDWVKAREHWSFRPVVKPAPPVERDAAWARTPIDRFVLAKLAEKNLTPAAPAGKRELLRRAYFDLVGLPPAPEEVEAFINDDSPGAFAAVVDRLLASPAYGERWGRHWLDVARYAEDQAHTFAVKPYTEAWRYRDWVIAAFNADLPYDRFVKLQIAADLMDLPDAERRRHLPALGFFGLGALYYGTGNAKAAADELDDRVDTFTRGLLGLTVSCARCHDHKFDPIPSQDYYSLAGVFANTKLAELPLGTKEEVKRFEEYQAQVKKLDETVNGALRKERAKAAAPVAGEVAKYMRAAWKRGGDAKFAPAGMNAAELNRWVKFLDGKPKAAALDRWMRLPRTAPDVDVEKAAEEFQKQVIALVAASAEKPLDKPKNDLLMALFGEKGVHPLPDAELKMRMTPEARQAFERDEGELKSLKKSPVTVPMAHGMVETGAADMRVALRGDPTKPGEVAPRRFLHVLAGESPRPFGPGSGRKELAESVAAADNPLFARVIVNRVWAWHFGRGLVGTPSNFGTLGERPTHPELLDYLAARLRESGWSLKALHREIMLSAVYQVSCGRSEANEAIDAENRYVWRMNRRRLDVESWRDAMLAISGRLQPAMSGPTFELSANSTRRTVYAKVSRHNLDGLLRLFDFPEANLTCERRTETTVPQQQLFVLNAPFMLEVSRSLAARIQRDAKDDASRVGRLFELALSRPPSAEEADAALQFLRGEDTADERAKIKLTRWERLAQVVLGGNEFMYVD